MKERPILFTAEMVRAILAGRKTQTRRPCPYILSMAAPEVVGARWFPEFSQFHLVNRAGRGIGAWDVKSPFGQPGDRLWVRETWIPGYGPVLMESEGDDVTAVSIIYKADAQELYRLVSEEIADEWGDFTSDGPNDPCWRPSIHMPRWAARITLEVTSVRVERVQDISGPDAFAEGIEIAGIMPQCVTTQWAYAVSAFRQKWNDIYGTWDANPFVWVVEFKRVEEKR